MTSPNPDPERAAAMERALIHQTIRSAAGAALADPKVAKAVLARATEQLTVDGDGRLRSLTGGGSVDAHEWARGAVIDARRDATLSRFEETTHGGLPRPSEPHAVPPPGADRSAPEAPAARVRTMTKPDFEAWRRADPDGARRARVLSEGMTNGVSEIVVELPPDASAYASMGQATLAEYSAWRRQHGGDEAV